MAKHWGWIPDSEHLFLLRAALEDGPEAVEAWRRWRRNDSLEAIDSAEMQVLPLVYRNLSRLDPDDPDLGLLRGVYRYTWSRNKILMHMGGRAVKLLAREGIETMLIKGGALLASGLQPDGGARRMADFDLMVPRAKAIDAIDALTLHFEPRPDLPHPRLRVPVHHSAPLLDHSGNELDLHWYALNRSSPDDAFWADSMEVELDGVPTQALNPTDQLLQVCTHGAVWGPQGPLRWVADAITVIRGGGNRIDWARLAAQAAERRLTLTMAESLTYLRDEFGADVPGECLERLEAGHVSLAERAARRASRSKQTPARMLVLHWDRYHRLKQLDPAAPRQQSFPAQLRSYWGDETYHAFSRHTVRYLLGDGR